MHAIFTNLAPIGPIEAEFFRQLAAGFDACGWTSSFWSTVPHPDLPRQIPLHWDLRRGLEHHDVDPLAVARGCRAIDLEKWRARVTGLIKQSYPPEHAPETVAKLAGASWGVLDAERPDLLLAWNHLCPHIGIAAEQCGALGIPTALLERGLLPNTWFLERGGLVGHSVYANVPLPHASDDRRDAYTRIGRATLATAEFSTFNRYPQADATEALAGLDARPHLGPRIAFFPPDDGTLGFTPADHDDRKRTLPGFTTSLEASLALAAATPGTVAFKPHPSFPPLPHRPHAPANHRIVDGDFRQLIGWSDIVAGTGSGLELVALMLGKPVLLFANEILRGKGVAYEATDAAGLAELVTCAFEDRDRQVHRAALETLLGYLLTEVLTSMPEHDDGHDRRTPARAVAELVNNLPHARESHA